MIYEKCLCRLSVLNYRNKNKLFFPLMSEMRIFNLSKKMFSLKFSRLNISQQRFLSRDGDASWCLVSAGTERLPEKVRIRELLIFPCLDRIPYYLLYNCSYHFPFFPAAENSFWQRKSRRKVCEFDARLVLPCLGMCFSPEILYSPEE